MDSQSGRQPAPLLHLSHPDHHIPGFEVPAEASPPPTKKFILILGVLAILGALLGFGFEHISHNAPTPEVSPIWVLPFCLLLVCIATMPFIARHFWEKNYQWVSLGLGALVSTYYVFGLNAGPRLAASLADYISFITLLGSLFIVSGGILIRIRRKASPAVNVALLLVGAIIANAFGTTGASMLLIRPFLRINKGHIRPYHIVFFILIVSNLGGFITPIGNPPYLGYLRGIPFWWVGQHGYLAWALANGIALSLFFIFDSLFQSQAPRAPHDENDLGPVVSIYGVGNLIFVALVLVGVFLPAPFGQILMAAGAICSLWSTSPRIHVENVFNFAPVKEVALLFLGIFATMVPALNYLSNHAKDEAFKKYLQTPGQVYFLTGTISSVLDNAPTYLAFLEAERGKLDQNLVAVATDVVQTKKSRPDFGDYARLALLKKNEYLANPRAIERDKQLLDSAILALRQYHGDKFDSGSLTAEEISLGFLLGDKELSWYIVAISLGSVFFGALTYLGNGPNFMVKSIAEYAGVKCPSFFGYIFLYSLPILLPILILVWAIFLRPHAGHIGLGGN